LTGEAFCGIEVVEFRQKLKVVCENYFIAFHRQNVHVSAIKASHSPWSLESYNVDCDYLCSAISY
jgi:hypothetical protein